mmetsp:Transcript_109400/g.217280  ORF Transcript_109400/g.217280 Transcript_109400/m.217280 type:complete len:248 (-) Transcript_109400:942-1685(-)
MDATGLNTPCGKTRKASPAEWSSSPVSRSLPFVTPAAAAVESSPRQTRFHSCLVQTERPTSARSTVSCSGMRSRPTNASRTPSRRRRSRKMDNTAPRGTSGAVSGVLTIAASPTPMLSSCASAANRFLFAFFRFFPDFLPPSAMTRPLSLSPSAIELGLHPRGKWRSMIIIIPAWCNPAPERSDNSREAVRDSDTTAAAIAPSLANGTDAVGTAEAAAPLQQSRNSWLTPLTKGGTTREQTVAGNSG